MSINPNAYRIARIASLLNSAPTFGPTLSIDNMKSLFSDGKRLGYIDARLSATLFAKRGGSFSMLAILIATLDSSPKCLISSLLKSKFCPSIETDEIEDLILFMSTGSVKFTATSVPPP